MKPAHIVSVLLLSTACSSSSSDGLGLGQSGGGSGGSVGAGGGAAGGAAGSSTSAGGAGGAGGDTGGGAGQTGGGGAAQSPIDPIVVGNEWVYDVTELGTYPLCPTGSYTGKVLSKGAKDGKPDALAVQSLCKNAGVVYYTQQGDVVQVDVAGTWVLALDAPVEEGHVWTDGVISYVWHEEGAVTVPGGTFVDCWRASADGADAYTIFCRGVGPVHWHQKDASGNGYDAVLTSTNVSPGG